MKRIITLLALTSLLGSCSLVGIHIKVHNPRKQAAYPKFSKEIIMLGEETAIRSNFDVTFYDLDLNINAAEKTIGGWVEVRARAVTRIDSVQLDLDDHMTLDDLRWGSREGQSLAHSRKLRGIFIKLPETIQAGKTFSIYIRYHGKPIIAKRPPWAGGLVWKKDKHKNHWAGVACESEGASIWFPCKDLTSDEPDSARLRFTIPDQSLFVVSNGKLTAVEKNTTGQSFTWRVSYPINLYNITFYLGDFALVEDTYKGINGETLQLSHYVLKPNVEKAKQHFAQVKKHIRVYEQLYGAYCWYNDGFKLVESPYAGMEHQSAIAYGNGYKNDLNHTDDYIILHEAGHEWFGNAITAADLADVWLQEGITTFGESLYLEKMYPGNAATVHLLVQRFTIKNKRPVVGPTGRRYFNYKDGDVYVKGAWLLHTLRHQIKNDTVFFNILRTFYQEQKLKVTDSKTFISTVNRITGKDYTWFFDQYLYNNFAPFLEYFQDDDGTFYYRWVQTNPGFDKLRVDLTLNNQAAIPVYPSQKIQVIKPEVTNQEPSFRVNDYVALFGKKKNKKLKKLYLKQNRS